MTRILPPLLLLAAVLWMAAYPPRAPRTSDRAPAHCRVPSGAPPAVAAEAPMDHVLFGEVTDGVAGVAEAWVVAERGGRRELTLTGADGRFELPLAEAGVWAIEVEADGFVVWQARTEVVDRAELTATLTALSRIRGTVDQSVPGVEVLLVASERGDEVVELMFEGAVAADGAFEVVVEPGRYELHLALHGYHWPVQATTSVAPAAERTVALALPGLGRLRGRMQRDAELASARITLQHVETRQKRELVVHEREFTLPDLDPGGYEVVAVLQPGRTRYFASAEIVAGATTTIEIGADQAILEGTVEPLRLAAGAVVSLLPFLDAETVDNQAVQTARADANGRFEFSSVEPGAYLVVGRNREASNSLRVRVAPHATQAIRMRLPDDAWELRVLRGGEPFAGGRLQLIFKPHMRLRRWVRTDANGVARLRGLPAGRYLARAGRNKSLVDLGPGATVELP